MGSCCSSMTPEERREKDRCKAIEKQTTKRQESDMMVKKLLLLGAGESGKSTLFKQMITLYGQGYSLEDRQGFTNIVYNNTISAMKTLVKHADDMAHYGYPTVIHPQNHPSKKALQDCKLDADVDLQLAKHIQILWNDPGILATFEQRAKFQLPDSAKYFFERAMFIGQADYIPTQQDILRSRVRTTGIVETSFEIEENQFRMFDVGGQRNERKKWIHCFEEVTAVIFVAAISEYDQVLYEDESTNRMHEALDLFDEICNSRWFRDTSIILFLNKRDLFMEKIKHVPLTVCFPYYNGAPDNYDEGVTFLQKQFEAKNRTNRKDDKVYTHVTCATDSRNIQHVFNAVKDMIIRQSLRAAGLMTGAAGGPGGGAQQDPYSNGGGDYGGPPMGGGGQMGGGGGQMGGGHMGGGQMGGGGGQMGGGQMGGPMGGGRMGGGGGGGGYGGPPQGMGQNTQPMGMGQHTQPMNVHSPPQQMGGGGGYGGGGGGGGYGAQGGGGGGQYGGGGGGGGGFGGGGGGGPGMI